MSSILDKARSRQQPKTAMTYDDFVKQGALKTYSVRLPVTTIAKLEELQQRHSTIWPSKQQLVFDLLEAAIEDWIAGEANPKVARDLMQRVAHIALQRRASGFDPA